MSVMVSSFDNPDGTWSYVHGDAPGGSHEGTLDPATVNYGKGFDGSEDLNTIAVPCPNCGAVSFWPPGGGADALLGQSLHVIVAYAQPGAKGAATDAAAEVKARCVATDGEERWVLDDAATARLKALAR